jgi:Tol biopolymer transport system component
MLSGQRAFTGATPADTMTAILKEDPPDLPGAERHIPPGLARIVDRCLEKNSGSRFQSAADLAFALESTSSASGSAIVIGGAAPAGMRERIAWAIAALFAIAAVVLGARHYLSNETPGPVIQAIIPPPDDWVISSLQAPMRLAVSPDGTRIAFTASTVERPMRTQLWVRRLDSLSAQPLAGTDNATGPFWSPDNRYIGFFADGKLKRIDASGGPPIALCDAVAGVGPPTGATWNQDDVILFASSGRGLARVPAAGGTPTGVTDPGQGFLHHLPFFLPDGHHFLYRVAGRAPAALDAQIHLGSLDSTDGPLLVRNTTQAMFSQGHILYARDGTLMAQPFDERRLELSGQPFPVAEQVLTGGGAASAFSVSANGVLVYQQGPVQRGFRLTWVDRAGKPVAELDEGLFGDLQLSSDGKRVAVSLASDSAGTRDIWIFERGLKTKFTSNPASENGVIWSPDDQRIIFSRTRANSGRDLILKASTNVGGEEVLLADGAENSPASWSPDGQFVLFGRLGRETGQDLWVLPLTGDRKPREFAASEAGEAAGRFSPDGRWVAYRSGETGQAEIFIAPFPGPGKKTRVSGEGGANPKWRRDGRELFYVSGDAIIAVDVDLRGTEPVVGMPHALFAVSMARVGLQSWYDVTPDGQQFLINANREALDPVPFTVISNWLAARKN